MIKFFDQEQMELQLMTIDPQTHLQELNDDLSRLEELVTKLQAEKAELLDIAFHLSQAVTRLGNSPIGIDPCHEHNDMVAIAQKSQEDLQEWISRNVVEVRSAAATGGFKG